MEVAGKLRVCIEKQGGKVEELYQTIKKGGWSGGEEEHQGLFGEQPVCH